MKTYIKTTWNWFRLLALGSILVCANSYRANAATTPTITYGALQPITYGTALGAAQFSAHAQDPVTLASLDSAGSFTYRINGQAVFASTPPLLANAAGYTISAEFTPFNSSLYNNATNSQTLVVDRLSLILNVGAPSRYYGEANPPFTSSWLPASGPVNGEITASLTSPAVPSSPVGTYTISASINDPQNKGANYTITATNALLTVTPAPITITPITRTIPYGTSNFITTTDPSAYTVTLPSTLVYRDDLSNIKAQITLYSTANPSNTFLHQNMVKSCYPQAGTYYYLVDYAVSKAASSGFTAGNLAANGKDGTALWNGVGLPIVNPNYTVVSNASPLIVQKVQMNLTAFTQTQEYGNIQNFTGTISGVVKAPDVTADTINVSGGNGVVTSTSIQGFDDNTNFVFTWSSVSSNAPPGIYNLTPSVTETVGAPGRLFNNYDPIVITPGVLTIVKRVPTVAWDIAPANQILTYGQVLSANQLNASINNALPSLYTNLPASALAYNPLLGSLPNAGPNTLSVVITGNDYWSSATYTRTISVAPFPTTMSWTGAKTSDGDMKGYIASIAYGTPLSATQLAAVTQGATNAQATSPGAVSYNVLGYNTSGGTTVGTAFPIAGPDGYNLFPVATYPSPLTGATPAAWILEAKAAANQNYGSVTQKVNLVVTNGVFDVASPAVSDMQSTPNGGPAVNLSFTGVAKIGSASAAASTKITVTNGLYYSSSAATTPALIYAFLVNTNSDAGATTPITFSPTEPGADGSFTLVPSKTEGPSALTTPTGMIPDSFYPGRGLPKGTNFELRVYYPDAYIKLPGNPGVVAQASALNGRTNFYKVTVGVLNTDITVNTDNSDKNYTYGSTDTISFPVSAKFRSGSGDLTGKAVHVEFNGVAQPDLTLSAPVSGVYSATFTFTIPNRGDYTVFHGPYAAKFTLDSAGDQYNGSSKSINVNFTRRDLHVHVSPTDTATVIYGENSDSANYVNPSYKAYANSYITPADIVSGDVISASNILPSIITPATGPEDSKRIPFMVGQVNWNGTLADSRDAFNYNVIKVDGTLKILRRTLTLAVGSVTAITNVAADVSGDWTVSNWAADGGSKSLVKAFGNGKIELQTSRVLNSPVGSQWYITNKWGAQVLSPLPNPPALATLTPITILTNYSEATDITTDYGTNQYSFYVDGPLGTNYFVKTAPHYNILTVIGIMPTVTWVTTNMTYGDSFSANNVLTAVVKTNGVVDTDPLTLAYEAVQNDVNGGGYVGIGTSSSSFKIPMATSSLGLKLTYVSRNPNVAKLDDAMAPKATATVAVNKAGLFVTAKQATAVKYNDAKPAGWGISFDINGVLNGDPISGGARAIFARDPLATGTMDKFASSVVTTNGANILSPVGSYPINAIVSDTGFNAPSNYNVVYIQGTYTVTGATASGGPAGWVETVDDGTMNIVRTYGWYFNNNDLIKYITNQTTFAAFSPIPGPSGRDNDAYKQFTITVGSDSAPANQSAVADGTLLPAGTNTIIFKYSYSDAYSPLYKTNKLQVRRYPIQMVVRWDAGVGAQVKRAYRDYFTFPVLWDAKGTNFGTNIAGPYTNFATFNAGLLTGTPDSRWSITNAMTDIASPTGHIVKYLTNGVGLPTNIMFATTNDTLDALGVQLQAGASDSPIGTYPVTASITSATLKNNYTLTVTPTGTATVEVTNATLRFVVLPASRAYGSENPTFSGTVNAVKSDGTTAYANVDGIYMTFTNYTTTNTVVGTYPIYSFVNDPNFKSGNYNPDMSASIGTLAITNAMLTVAPSPYPKPYRLRPGQAKPVFTGLTPTGFVNGQDSSVITTMPTWDSAYTPTAAIGATFDITNKTAGVAPNYAFTYIKGSVVVAANTPPTGMSDVITVVNTNVTKIVISKLLANDVSPFGDALSLDLTEFPIGIGKNSTRGINIQKDNTGLWLYYNTAALALDATPGSYDTFTYSVKDSLGAKGTATVFVKVLTTTPNYVPNNIAAATQDPITGAITLTFLGISGRTYHVQGATDVRNGPWTNLELIDRNVFPNYPTGTWTKTNAFTCVNGVIKATDPDAGTVGNRFYRAITPQ